MYCLPNRWATTRWQGKVLRSLAVELRVNAARSLAADDADDVQLVAVHGNRGRHPCFKFVARTVNSRLRTPKPLTLLLIGGCHRRFWLDPGRGSVITAPAEGRLRDTSVCARTSPCFVAPPRTPKLDATAPKPGLRAMIACAAPRAWSRPCARGAILLVALLLLLGRLGIETRHRLLKLRLVAKQLHDLID